MSSTRTAAGMSINTVPFSRARAVLVTADGLARHVIAERIDDLGLRGSHDEATSETADERQRECGDRIGHGEGHVIAPRERGGARRPRYRASVAVSAVCRESRARR